VNYILIYLIIPICMITFFYGNFFKNTINEMFLEFRNIVLILSGLSLLFWILAIMGVSPNESLSIGWGGVHTVPGYFYMHFITQGSTDFLGINTIRNTGIFVEAPMYSYILSLAFVINLFLDSDSKLIDLKSGLLIVTILSTTSTTGIIVLFISIIYYQLFIKNTFKYKMVKYMISILVILVTVIFLRIILQDKVDSVWYSSSSLRLDDFTSGYMSWMNHPIIGNGLRNDISIINNMNYKRVISGLTGLSSGLMMVLPYGGIILLLFYLVPTVLSMIISKNIFGVAFVAFILFAFTSTGDVYIYIILLSYFWASYLIKKDVRGMEIV